MTTLSTTARLACLVIAALVCSVAIWGFQFLPASPRPYRPLYMLAWLALSGGSYLAVRRKNRTLRHLADTLSLVFGAGFVLSLLATD